MFNPAILALGVGELWYMAVLVIVVSLVYAATRHELMEPILQHAVRFAVWICGFMFVVLLVLLVISWATSNT